MHKEIQYIQNDSGQTAGVFIPIKKWNALKAKNKELEALEKNVKSSANILIELREAVKELAAIERGEKKSRPIKALLNEL
jgi:hypothetical protein